MKRCTLDTSFGQLLGTRNDRGWTRLVFVSSPPREAPPDGSDTDLGRALRAYLAGELDALNTVPIELVGTPFQVEVWTALRRLPPGETTTYGTLAAQLGKPPGAARAVGAAVGANPLAMLVPCHRVLGQDGSLTGFAWGLERKRALLEHEGWRDPERAQQRLF